MKNWGKFILIQLLLPVCSVADNQYEMWSPSWMPQGRDDLLCKDNPKRTISHDAWCNCNSLPAWEIHQNSLLNLDIEFVSTLGKSLLIFETPVGHQRNHSKPSYSISFRYRELQLFPSNLCEWDSDAKLLNLYGQQFKKSDAFFSLIVKIDLSYNEINQMIDLNCLERLDTLDLSHNHITSLSNTSLSNLTYLRKLYLQHNLIKLVDAGIIASPKLSLQRVDLSHNKLDHVDVTNVVSLYPFCEIDYDGNNIHTFVNELDFKLDKEKAYGPGMVTITNNAFEKFPDFKELLHLDSLAELGNLMKFGFDLRGMPIICDCNLEPFMDLAQSIIETVWRDYFDVKCTGPDHLKGESIRTFINKTKLDHLVCNLTDTPKCFPCHCMDQPSKSTLFVNCRDKGLKDLPAFLPDSKFSRFIDLDLSGNQITTLKKTSYLSSVSHLSLADNNLIQIEPDAAYMLENVTVLNLTNNTYLSELPIVLQYTNNSHIIMHNLTIDCGCDSVWIQNWRGFDRSDGFSAFKCRVPDHGIIPAEQFTEDILDCDQVSNVLITLKVLLAAAVFTLIIAGLVSYWLRYEILILLIRFKQVSTYVVCPTVEYDAYISYDDDNNDLRKWTNMTLITFLEKSGYKVFVPNRDMKFGDVRDLNTIETLSKTKSFLLILSESYIEKSQNIWIDHEWKYGWHMFKTNRTKSIVMINFDQCLASDVTCPQMKAFLRVGSVVDFSNLDSNILNQIASKLGPPSSQLLHPCPSERNQKYTATPLHLFQTQKNRTMQEQDLRIFSLKGKGKSKSTKHVMAPKAEIHVTVTRIPAGDRVRNETELGATVNNRNVENTGILAKTMTEPANILTDIDDLMLVTEKQRPSGGIYKYYS